MESESYLISPNSSATRDISLSLRLEGKVALITGGASGIGQSIAKHLRQHGAKVIVADINDSLAGALCESLGGESYARFIHCDITVEEQVRLAIEFTVSKFGTLDIMVNNAGKIGSKVTDIRNVDAEEEFRKLLELNVTGVFHCMKHASRIMIPNKSGSIISLASVAGVIGGLGPHGYTTSKHAVVGLTKSVAAELGKHGIRVNCVSPFMVPTGAAISHFPQSESREDTIHSFLEFVRGHANLKGVDLMAKDVADAVVFLASEESRYVSGINLIVDGGFTSCNNILRQFE